MVQPDLIIEPMSVVHVKDVLAIERTVFSDPWSEHSFMSEIGDSQVSLSRVALNYPERVLVGYFVAWIIADEIHLGNIAVDPARQNNGIGQRLLDDLVEHGRRRKAGQVTLEVRESNIAAQRLYLKNGFQPIAVRRKYYPDNREDAIVMMLNL